MVSRWCGSSSVGGGSTSFTQAIRISVDQSIVARETEAIVALLRVLNVPVAHRQRLRDGALTPEAWKDWLAMTNQWVHEAHAQGWIGYLQQWPSQLIF